MQVVECERYLRNIEADLLLLESALPLHEPEELAARHEIHHEVDAVLALEHELHLHDEGVINLEHNHFLEADVFDAIMVHHHVFAHRLKRVEARLCPRQVHQVNFGKSTLSQHRDRFELLKQNAITNRAPLVDILCVFAAHRVVVVVLMLIFCLSAVVQSFEESSAIIQFFDLNLLIV